MVSRRWGGPRPAPYNPDAVDSDNDGLVQEGTIWERPGGTRFISRAGREIAAAVSSVPSGAILVDSDGNQVDHTPRGGAPGGGAPGSGPRTGASTPPPRQLPTLEDWGYPSIQNTVGTISSPPQPTPDPGTTPVDTSRDPRDLPGPESVDDLVDTIKDTFSLENLKLDLYERSGDGDEDGNPVMVLSRIELPVLGRGGGVGSEVMQKIIDYADENGYTIALTPSGDFGGNVKRLKEFYGRFGFVNNKGKNKDFTMTESMYRRPSGSAVDEIADSAAKGRRAFSRDNIDTGALESGILKVDGEHTLNGQGISIRTKGLLDKEDLPDEVYHITTAKDAVDGDQALLVNAGGEGLGGGAADALSNSITVDREVAETLFQDMFDYFSWMRSGRSDDETREHLKLRAQGEGWDFKDRGTSGARYIWTQYFHERSSQSPGKERNPMFVGTADADPEQIKLYAIPRENIPDDAVVSSFDIGDELGLEEARVWGDVPLDGAQSLPLPSKKKQELAEEQLRHRDLLEVVEEVVNNPGQGAELRDNHRNMRRFHGEQKGELHDIVAEQMDVKRKMGEATDQAAVDELALREEILEDKRELVRQRVIAIKRAEVQLRNVLDREGGGSEEEAEATFDATPITDLSRFDSNLIPDKEVKVLDSLKGVDDAMNFLFEENGRVDEVPDHLLFEAMMGGELENWDGQTILGGDILEADPDALDAIASGDKWSNERFEFTSIKDDRNDFGFKVWNVFEVKDKNTDKTYFLKSSMYGNDDALMEAVGGEFQRLVGFDVDEEGGNARVSPWFEGTHRWQLIPHVANYNPVSDDTLDFEDVGDVHGQRPIDPDNQDIARLLVMDYILNNNDRHAGNLLVVRDGDTDRLVPIDHGLIGFGRPAGETPLGYTPNQGESLEEIAEEAALYRPKDYYLNSLNTPVEHFFDSASPPFETWDRAEVEAEVERLLELLEDIKFENFFDPDRLGRRGVRWTGTEKQHLEAAKTMAIARLEYLRTAPKSLTNPIQA